MVDGENQIIWDESEYSLGYLLENFPLPQIIQVAEGFMFTDENSLSRGTILTLHGLRVMTKLKGQDDSGREFSVPINCPYEVKLISRKEKKIVVFHKVSDLCKASVIPEFFIPNRRVSRGKIAINPGEPLKLVSVNFTKHGKTKGVKVAKVNCSESSKSKTQTVSLPLKTTGDFTPCVSPNPEKGVFLLKELVESSHFPLKVRFVARRDGSPNVQPISEEIEFHEIITAEVVFATTRIDGVTYAITFPRNFPVTLQVARGMLNNDEAYSNICRISNERIDVNVIEDLLKADPYAGFCLNSVYNNCSKRGDLSLGEGTKLHSSTDELFSASPRGGCPQVPRQMNRPPAILPRSSPKGSFSLIDTLGVETKSAGTTKTRIRSQNNSDAQGDSHDIILRKKSVEESSMSDNFDNYHDEDGYQRMYEFCDDAKEFSKWHFPPTTSTGYCYPIWLPVGTVAKQPPVHRQTRRSKESKLTGSAAKKRPEDHYLGLQQNTNPAVSNNNLMFPENKSPSTYKKSTQGNSTFKRSITCERGKPKKVISFEGETSDSDTTEQNARAKQNSNYENVKSPERIDQAKERPTVPPKPLKRQMSLPGYINERTPKLTCNITKDHKSPGTYEESTQRNSTFKRSITCERGKPKKVISFEGETSGSDTTEQNARAKQNSNCENVKSPERIDLAKELPTVPPKPLKRQMSLPGYINKRTPKLTCNITKDHKSPGTYEESTQGNSTFKRSITCERGKPKKDISFEGETSGSDITEQNARTKLRNINYENVKSSEQIEQAEEQPAVPPKPLKRQISLLSDEYDDIVEMEKNKSSDTVIGPGKTECLESKISQGSHSTLRELEKLHIHDNKEANAFEKSKEDIRTKDESEILEILDLLNLSDFKATFHENQINGDLLMELNRHTFVQELQMSEFEALKLKKYIQGWRPDSPKATNLMNIESLDPAVWPSKQVCAYMRSLNLCTFAAFCEENQVNGELLKSILEEDILNDIKQSYNIQMNTIEEIRLRRFVLNCWRPDKMKKGEAGKYGTL